MHKGDITLDSLSKIEGHADLVIKIKDKKVEDINFSITEHKRFFTQAMHGKHIEVLPQHLSRICGTCSIAHLLCSIESIEKALEVKVSEQTKLLRKLSMYGLMIRDHALHLYLLALPDVLGKNSVLDFGEEYHNYIHDAFDVKAVGNKLAIFAAGRSVHAPFPIIGGFNHTPDNSQIPDLIKSLESIRETALKLIEIYYKCNFKLERETNFVGLKAEEYGFIEGRIHTSNGEIIEEKDYLDHLNHIVIPYSESSAYEFEGKEYMVGALARLNLGKELLHKRTQESCRKELKEFPSINIYRNNLAQAIEILHSIDHSIEILEKTKFRQEAPVKFEIRASEGVGVVEAPRGTLYHRVKMDDKGIVTDGNIIVPTSQNQINMRDDLKKLVQENIDKSKDFIVNEAEKLIRAYDPCMSCASHFLRVKWV